MEAYTREAIFWRALALGKPEELPEPINGKEHYMRLYALKTMGGTTAENAIPVAVPEEATDFLGKKLKDFVTGMEILMDGNVAHVTGSAHYVTGFTEFNSTVPEEQEGWYFPVTLNESGASTMTFRKNGIVTKKDIPYDPQCLFRIESNDTAFEIETDTGKKIAFDFDGMTLEAKAE